MSKRGGEANETFSACMKNQINNAIVFGKNLLSGKKSNVRELWDNITKDMSLYGGPIRDCKGIIETLDSVKAQIASFKDSVSIYDPSELKDAYRLWDILICQRVYLEAMADYSAKGGKSRGSALYTDPDGSKPYDFLPDKFTFTLDEGSNADIVQQVVYSEGICKLSHRKVRKIPNDDSFFENVWRGFRKNQNID